MSIKLAVVGGTGLDSFLEGGSPVTISADYRDKGEHCQRSYEATSCQDGQIVFVNRHSVPIYPAELVSPSNIDYNTLMVGLYQYGVTHVISTSAVGINKEALGVGTTGVPDDFVDRLNFDVTIEVAGVKPDYVEVSEPFDPQLRKMIKHSAYQNYVKIQNGGIYIRTKFGRVFETRAETAAITAAYPGKVLYYGMSVPQEAILAGSFGRDESGERKMKYANITVATNLAADLAEHINHEDNRAAFGIAIPKIKKILKGAIEDLFRV